MDSNAGHQGRSFKKDWLTAILQRIGTAPAVTRLADDDVVAEPCQLSRHASQEMGVAVIPAGAESMIEERRLHAIISSSLRTGRSAEPAGNNSRYSEQ